MICLPDHLTIWMFTAGSLCGQAIADHKDVRKLGFTGSTEIGQVIMKSCAVSNLKKVSLELGGKSPFIIFADCDFDKAVRMVRTIIKFSKEFELAGSKILLTLLLLSRIDCCDPQ